MYHNIQVLSLNFLHWPITSIPQQEKKESCNVVSALPPYHCSHKLGWQQQQQQQQLDMLRCCCCDAITPAAGNSSSSSQRFIQVIELVRKMAEERRADLGGEGT